MLSPLISPTILPYIFPYILAFLRSLNYSSCRVQDLAAKEIMVHVDHQQSCAGSFSALFGLCLHSLILGSLQKRFCLWAPEFSEEGTTYDILLFSPSVVFHDYQDGTTYNLQLVCPQASMTSYSKCWIRLTVACVVLLQTHRYRIHIRSASYPSKILEHPYDP